MQDGVRVQGEYEKLRRDLVRVYPELKFRAGKKFTFRPPRTIIYEPWSADSADFGQKSSERDCGSEQNNYCLQLLHEVGHALSEHRDYRVDVERVKMEREAWERARGLCEEYNVWYDEEFVEEEMDTYREWLHRRSKCRECGLTRYQTLDGKYHCPRCEAFMLSHKRHEM